MPLIDGNAHLTDLSGHAAIDGAEVQIIGSGVLGMALAVTLARQGMRVVVLESGRTVPDEGRQALNTLDQVGKRFGDANWTRKRIVGGTSTAWGGQSLPFTPQDFAQRPWVPDSGWPIAHSEVAAHYDAANAIMGIDPRPDEVFAQRFGLSPPAPHPDVRYHLSKWAPEPNFAKLYRREIQSDIALIHNAHVVDITMAESGRVAGLALANFAGERTVLPAAPEVVIAAGGIESVRLLLAARSQRPAGLGNASGVLGRYFMEHPCVEAGVTRAPVGVAGQRLLGTHRLWNGARFSKRISASPRWQEANRALNISATFLFRRADGSHGALNALRALKRRPRPADGVALVRGMPELAAGAQRLVMENLAYKPGALMAVSLMCEQPPTLQSHIALSERTDPFGVPLARLDWQIAPQVPATIAAYARTVQAVLAADYGVELELAPIVREAGLGHHERGTNDLTDDLTNHLTDALSDVNHHMGGARMSALEGEGVVDPDLRVWGTANLSVCSAAVFPTASHSNPTLTALALTMRLAARILAARPL